jgi:hypothetical protein
MVFGIISILCILAVSLRLTFGRYVNRLPEEGKKISAENMGAYAGWIYRWKISFLKSERWTKSFAYFFNWTQKNYPGWQVWVFYFMALSYFYLALGGFFFAWFIPRGLYGFPLLVHVACGAFFALSLTVIVFLKARFYLPENIKSEPHGQSSGGFYCLLLKKSFPRIYLQAAAFWLFVLAGFFLILSTLGSMLPYFNYPAQIFFFNLHRWSALASVVSAILGIDSIID